MGQHRELKVGSLLRYTLFKEKVKHKKKPTFKASSFLKIKGDVFLFKSVSI